MAVSPSIKPYQAVKRSSESRLIHSDYRAIEKGVDTVVFQGQTSLEPPQYLYHITFPYKWQAIQASGGLKPQSDPRGNYMFDLERFQEQWTKPSWFFGSPIQALLMALVKRAKALAEKHEEPQEELLMLRIKVDPEEDELHVANLNWAFNRLNAKAYYNSCTPMANYVPQETDILEWLIRPRETDVIPLERIEVFRRIPLMHFPSANVMSKRKIAPEKLLNVVLQEESEPIEMTGQEKRLFFYPTLLLGTVVFAVAKCLPPYGKKG